ncbi:hypothetical protein KCU97_g37, partial [Aureobasidium melanogenum]
MAGRRLVDRNMRNSRVYMNKVGRWKKVHRMDSRYLGFLSLGYSPTSCFKPTCPADHASSGASGMMSCVGISNLKKSSSDEKAANRGMEGNLGASSVSAS